VLLALLEITPIFFPLALIAQLLIFPINPFESSNLLDAPTCFTSEERVNTLIYDY
jgi:hypothetical protein